MTIYFYFYFFYLNNKVYFAESQYYTILHMLKQKTRDQQHNAMYYVDDRTSVCTYYSVCTVDMLKRNKTEPQT